MGLGGKSGLFDRFYHIPGKAKSKQEESFRAHLKVILPRIPEAGAPPPPREGNEHPSAFAPAGK